MTIAEAGGFEPPDGLPSLVFKTSAFGRSAILPMRLVPLKTFYTPPLILQLPLRLSPTHRNLTPPPRTPFPAAQ